MQEAVFDLLSNPATYGAGLLNREIRRFQTHAAVVFLAGDRALKVKRAVRYPFLDYSTLGKRKAACEAELEVNRRFAPQLYRGVVPITREADGSLALNGVGEPIEWAVEMARFDENRTLDHLAERDELDDTLLGKLAVAVAAMHDRAEPWTAARGSEHSSNSSATTARSFASMASCSRRKRCPIWNANRSPCWRGCGHCLPGGADRGWSAAATATFT